VVVRSDDVNGNEVTGAAWPLDESRQVHGYVALFTDDGEVINCTLEAAAGD